MSDGLRAVPRRARGARHPHPRRAVFSDPASGTARRRHARGRRSRAHVWHRALACAGGGRLDPCAMDETVPPARNHRKDTAMDSLYSHLRPWLPLFDGFRYLNTRVVPALYHIILLPARASETSLADTAGRQVLANRLSICLVLGPDRAIYYEPDGRCVASDERPRGGNLIAGGLAPPLTSTTRARNSAYVRTDSRTWSIDVGAPAVTSFLRVS